MISIKVNCAIKNKNKYLVVKRSQKDGGFWQTITGTVESKDNFLCQTIAREILEETGLSVRFMEGVVHLFTWTKKNSGEVVELCYVCETWDNKVKLSKEHTAFEWLTLSQAIKRVEKENNKEFLRQLK
jgi:8-oxo-dGTP pyrophosphatase MutT (NUDIX family)